MDDLGIGGPIRLRHRRTDLQSKHVDELDLFSLNLPGIHIWSIGDPQVLQGLADASYDDFSPVLPVKIAGLRPVEDMKQGIEISFAEQ